MGYYTNYSLSADKELPETFGDNFESVTGYILDGMDLYYAKWYDHDKDMKKISTLYSDILFTLKGEGEEPGDLWIAYYKNGKVQLENAQITYSPFDESKLK